jgi:hypothetical protein
VVSSLKPSAQFGGLGLKTIGDRFRGFGPQNPGGGSEEKRMARDDIEEFASRRSYLMKGACSGRQMKKNLDGLTSSGYLEEYFMSGCFCLLTGAYI